MEATLKVISDLRNIRNMHILVRLIILHELEVHLLREEDAQPTGHGVHQPAGLLGRRRPPVAGWDRVRHGHRILLRQH